MTDNDEFFEYLAKLKRELSLALKTITRIKYRNRKDVRERIRIQNNISQAKRIAAKLNATPQWSEEDKIKILYEKTKWLESLTGLKYHVDHIIPLQGENVSGLHVWSNLQILEAKLNQSKNNKLKL